MKELVFDSGLVTYNINGKCEVSFNPSDAAFVEKLYDSFDELDKKQNEYKDRVEEIKDDKAIFDFARARDAEMREIIDRVLGAPVCDALFGDMSVYALANGLPVWMNLMLAIVDEIEANYSREQKAQNPRIQKYTNKYNKYMKAKK